MWEPNYITVEAFKSYVNIEASDASDDVAIALDIAAASRAIDRCCSSRLNGLGARRQFGQVVAPEARFYTPRWDTEQVRWIIEVDDFMTTVGLTITLDTSNQDMYSSTITDYVPRPKDALERGRPYTQLSIKTSSTVQPYVWPDSAKVTCRWGWSAFPDVVVRATYLQAHRYNKRRTAPFGVAGAQQNNSEVPTHKAVDPDILEMLATNDLIKLGWTP